MAPSRHRGTHSGSRKPGRSLRAAAGVLVAVVALASVGVAGVLAFAEDGPSATSFTGVVTNFADEGTLVCVQRPGASDAPFCDQYYVAPGAPDITVGERVVVTTIATEDQSGESVSGMLVQPAS